MKSFIRRVFDAVYTHNFGAWLDPKTGKVDQFQPMGHHRNLPQGQATVEDARESGWLQIEVSRVPSVFELQCTVLSEGFEELMYDALKTFLFKNVGLHVYIWWDGGSGAFPIKDISASTYASVKASFLEEHAHSLY